MSRARSVGRLGRSLRFQLAAFVFLAIYLPVLALVGVSEVTETSVEIDGVEVTEQASTERPPWMVVTAVALAPFAAFVAWSMAGWAVRPIDGVRRVAEDIEGSDLTRRIALRQGPTELVALAASFDGMLDRLERAAGEQQQLIDEASHELRTPLAVLTMNADVLLAHPDPTVDDYRAGLERSRAAAGRLQATIDDLLVDARGRARTIERHPVDLMEIASGVVDDARVLAAPRDVEVVLSGPASVERSLDEPTVSRAISNLLDNAIRHAPPSSTVEVGVDVDGTDVVIGVVDHGSGLATDDLDHVFDRRWQGRSDAGGSGLGLAIAQQIAIAHGGSLTVTSPGPAGDGCAFELRLRRVFRLIDRFGNKHLLQPANWLTCD